MTIAPRYDQYKDAWDTCVVVDVCVESSYVAFLLNGLYFFVCFSRNLV